MAEDYETILVAKNEADRQLEKAIAVVKSYEEKIQELHAHAEVMEKEKIHAEQREQKAREIMTQNITESNARMEAYMGEILELKGIIQQLKAQLK